MSGITTHVLDIAAGKPATGVATRLDYLSGSGWERVSERTTDEDGRVRDLHLGPQIPKGVYRITFATRLYFHSKGAPTFYPEVQVMFEVGDPGQHYHVPLLLGAYGYSTYRGT